MTLLKEISDAAAYKRKLEKQITHFRAEWETFLFFAQRKEGYEDFLVKQLSAGARHGRFTRPRFNVDHAKTTEGASFKEGEALLKQLIKAEGALDEADRLLSALLRRAWRPPSKAEPLNEELPLSQIEEAYGGSGSAAYAYITEQKWFDRRKGVVNG